MRISANQQTWSYLYVSLPVFTFSRIIIVANNNELTKKTTESGTKSLPTDVAAKTPIQVRI